MRQYFKWCFLEKINNDMVNIPLSFKRCEVSGNWFTWCFVLYLWSSYNLFLNVSNSILLMVRIQKKFSRPFLYYLFLYWPYRSFSVLTLLKRKQMEQFSFWETKDWSLAKNCVWTLSLYNSLFFETSWNIQQRIMHVLMSITMSVSPILEAFQTFHFTYWAKACKSLKKYKHGVFICK